MGFKVYSITIQTYYKISISRQIWDLKNVLGKEKINVNAGISRQIWDLKGANIDLKFNKEEVLAAKYGI